MTEQLTPPEGQTRTGCPVDLWSGEFNENFWPEINRMQDSDTLEVHMQGETPCYVATRYEDVFKILRDWKRFSSEYGVAILGGDNRSEAPKNEGRFLPEDLDPPAQTDWRKLLNPELTEEKMRRFVPTFAAAIDALLDAGIASGRFRVMEDFLRPLQLRAVFTNLLLLGDDRIDDWMRWAHDIFVAETPEASGEAYVSLYSAIEELVKERMANPIDGGTSSVWSPPSRRSTAANPPSRSASQSSCRCRSPAWNPPEPSSAERFTTWQRTPTTGPSLLPTPTLVSDAVEEGLRMFANVTVLQRTTTCPVTIGGTELDEGAKVWTSYNGANRDPPRKFDDPPTRGTCTARTRTTLHSASVRIDASDPTSPV